MRNAAMPVIGRAAQLKVRGGLDWRGRCPIIAGGINMAKDKILVVELTTAGGMGTGKERIEAISIEGLAMVHALVTDAVNGDFETHVVLQEAIEPIPRLASATDVHWHRIGSGTNLQDVLKELAPKMSFCFIVAPEFSGYLEHYTRLLESFGCVVLSQPSSSVAVASDKAGALGRLSKAGVAVPVTQSLDRFIVAPAVKYPVVVKPNRGAGSIGVFLAHDSVELDDAVAANEAMSFTRKEIIVQEFVTGIPLSASAIATPLITTLLGINEQDVSLSPARVSESKYRGGIAGPLHPELAVACERVARAAAREFQLEGYFGFDFILDPRGKPVIVEINPRLTTSFAGLKILHPESMLRFMVDSRAHKGIKMPWIPRDDFAAYRIVDLPGSNDKLPGKIDLLEDQNVFTMKLPGGGASAFITVHGPTRAAVMDGLVRLGARLQRDEDE
jgi:tyramine---L-glutamate ligase